VADPLRTISTVAALETALADRILDGDPAAGAHLRETELAAEYRVARHSLRAACDALVRRGLLVKLANRGFFVPDLTEDDAREIFALRRALEAPVVRELAQRAELPAATAAALDRLRALREDAPWRDVVLADLDFHRGLVEAVPNRRLARAHADLLAEIALCIAQTGWAYESTAEVVHEHERLADAIRSGDPDSAERELDWHFGQGKARLRGTP
jgi:DNA-binding GntR family transcriptional regulator